MRRLREGEGAALFSGLDAWGNGVAHKVIADRVPMVDDDGLVSLVSPALARLAPSGLLGATAGLVVGSLRDGAFVLGIQGAVRAGPHARSGVVRVSDKASALWLYGRNILPDSVMDHDHRLRPGDACIVTDPRHDVIGVGEVVGTFKGRREVVRPLHDLGSYLRDQDA